MENENDIEVINEIVIDNEKASDIELVKGEYYELPRGFAANFDYIGHLKFDSKKVLIKCKICPKNKKPLNVRNNDIKYVLQRHLMNIHKLEIPNSTDNKLQNLDVFITKPKYSNSDQKQMKFEDNLLDFLAVDGNNYSVVSGDCFKNMIHHLDPKINIKSRQIYADKLIKRVDTDVLPWLINIIQNVDKLHTSVDIWTTRRNEGVLGIKSHFIANDWKLYSFTLTLQKFNQRHTAENISEAYQKCLKDLGIKTNQIGVSVTDNAANMIKAWKLIDIIEQDLNIGFISDEELSDDLQENDEAELCHLEITENEGLEISNRLSCIAHSIQLCINKALQQDNTAKNILNKSFKIIQFFTSSTFWRSKLRESCAKDLIKKCPTRWNYCLSAINRLTENDIYTKVQQLLLQAIEEEKRRDIPTLEIFEDRVRIRELSTLLTPLALVTQVLQGDGITFSSVIFQIFKAFKSISELDINNFKIAQNGLLDQIKTRFEKLLMERHYVTATILDPRQKLDTFKWCRKINIDNNVNNLPQLQVVTDELALSYLKSLSSSILPQAELTLFSPSCLFSELDSVRKGRLTAEFDELDIYLKEPCTDMDPLEFWKQNSLRYPILSKAAQEHLSIPASTGGIERVFSIAGALGRARRSRLSVESLKANILYRQYKSASIFQRKNLKRLRY